MSMSILRQTKAVGSEPRGPVHVGDCDGEKGGRHADVNHVKHVVLLWVLHFTVELSA